MNLKDYLILIGILGTLERMNDANLSSQMNTFMNTELKPETMGDIQEFMGTAFKDGNQVANSMIELIKTEMPQYVK